MDAEIELIAMMAIAIAVGILAALIAVFGWNLLIVVSILTPAFILSDLK